MYDFVDRPVTCLDRGGRFLVWSMRSWARVIGKGNCPASAIAPAFARWAMIGGLQPFHRAMLLLSRDALETVRFCSMTCNHVAEHEAIVLSLLASLQEGEADRARGTLGLMAAEDSIGDLLGAPSELACAMNEARIPLGRPPAPQPERARGDSR